ncbi:sensor histidine kinase [Natrialbaceae archaeon A-chndr2]
MSYLQSALTLSPLKVSAGYLIFGVIWVPTTDILLAVSFESQQMPTLLGLIKAWTFIGLSTLLIYSLSSIHHEQMAATQTKLQRANQQLQVLHRVFRHNIRNDLNVVLGYTDLLSEQVSERQANSYIETIHQTTEQIITISEKLKAVESVDPTLSDEEAVDLVELVATEVEELRDAHPEVTVRTEFPDHAWIQADTSVQYTIREVLENAVDHNEKTPTEREISAEIDHVNGEVLLEIADNGSGIPQEELRAFQKGEETPLIHSSSVGLWLIRWLTQINDGSVTYENDDGTTVSLRLQAGSNDFFLNTESEFERQIQSTLS